VMGVSPLGFWLQLVQGAGVLEDGRSRPSQYFFAKRPLSESCGGGILHA
jgi:hypothetical protein